MLRSNGDLGLQSNVTNGRRLFRCKISAIMTKVMLLHLKKLKQFQIDDDDSKSKKMFSYFEKAAFNSSFSKRDANELLLDKDVGAPLQRYLGKAWHKVSGLFTNPVLWKPSRHRLCALFLLYSVSRQRGNEMIWDSIHKPYKNLLTIIRLIRRDSKLNHSTFSLIIPKAERIDINKLFSCILSQFSEIDIYPYCPEEQDNIELIKLIMERFIPNKWPLDILLLLEEDKIYDTWKVLYESRENMRLWKNTLNDIPYSCKKYVKLIVIFFKRASQLQIRYTNTLRTRIKCLKTMPNDWKSNLLTFCTYCMECLTFVDINKRPASFGHYLNADTLRQYCHRDDSDRLILLSCFNPTNYVELEITHPDRHPITICQGKRSCFALVSFVDKLCPTCSNELGILEIHENTCIGNATDEDEAKCRGCEFVTRWDGKIGDKITDARKENKKKQLDMKLQEETLKTEKENKRRMYDRYRFQRAHELNQRRKLLK